MRVDSGDRNSELTVEVDRDRAAAFGFSANDVATFVGLALRGAPLREFRRGDTEVPVWVRFAGADNYGTEDLASFTVRAPDGRSVPLLAMVNVQRAAGRFVDRAHQPPDDADDHLGTSATRSRSPMRARRSKRRSKKRAKASRPVTAIPSTVRSS